MAVPQGCLGPTRSDPAHTITLGDSRSPVISGAGPLHGVIAGATVPRTTGPSLRRRAMGQHYVGLDVSLETTSVCVLDEAGGIVWRGKVGSTPEALANAIRTRAPQVARIGLETGPLCTWHWHALRALGLPVICLDARHAKAALSVQVNKTDANDAYGLAQIVRAGWYKEVAVKSLDSHRLRTLLSSRAQLVNMRRDLGTQAARRAEDVR